MILKYGGSLKQNKIFSKILSIGYEFETDDITKLSLHSDGHTLVNSDLSLRTLGNEPKIVDENYIVSRFSKQIYNDYFYEYRESDTNKTDVKFQITNDMGFTEFLDYLEKLRANLKIPKNEMFYFKPNNSDKIYDIKFTDAIEKTENATFSKVEYVITYYKPKIKQNIIIDTFVDACSRIIEHLSNLTQMPGNLIIKTDDNKLNPVGMSKAIINKRILYNKPGTNLYYMDIYDYDKLKKPQTINESFFVPQMTFRSKSKDCIDIIKCIVELDNSYEYGISKQDKEQSEYQVILMIENIIDNLFDNYNNDTTTKHKIPINTDTFKILKCYIFFIYYKLYIFIYSHAEILNQSGDNIVYLKDFITFSCRHDNLELYKHIKYILKKKYNITNVKDIHKLLVQPELIKVFYEREYVEGEDELYNFDFGENEEYKFNKNAYKDNLKSSDKNFGNPLYSFSSYFELLDKKNDWLKSPGSEYDSYSTTFTITDNKTMVEFRMFRNAIPLHYQNNLDNYDFNDDGISINQMKKIIAAYNEDLNHKGKKTKKNKEIQHVEINEKNKHVHFDKTKSKSKSKQISEKISKKSDKQNNKIERKKRCSKGTRKNRITGNCETPQLNTKKRCSKGTRKNKKTGNCDKINK